MLCMQSCRTSKQNVVIGHCVGRITKAVTSGDLIYTWQSEQVFALLQVDVNGKPWVSVEQEQPESKA